MRFIMIFFFYCSLLNLSSCQTSKITDKGKTLINKDSLDGISRKMYLCTGKKLEITETKGSLSYNLIDNEKTNVIQFFYEKDMDKVAYDGGYKEEVVFEVPNSIFEKDYLDLELQNTKMLFGRYCFCRGKTGLYKIKQGKLHVSSSKKEMHFELQFKINEVPQLVSELKY